MSLSSETPYLRSFGNEILLHNSENIDMSRTMPNGLPLLVSHNDEQLPVGRLKNVRLDEVTKKLRADAYFSNRPEAQAVRQDILDGIVADVSIGYKILDYKVEKSLDETPNNVFVTRWLPYEGSMVAIAADHQVGVGRSDDEEIEIDLERACVGKKDLTEEKSDNEEKMLTEEEETTEVQAETEEEATENPAEEATEILIEEAVEEEEELATENPKDNKKTKSEVLTMNSDLVALKQAALNLGIKTEAEIDLILQKSLTIEETKQELLKASAPNIITSRKTTDTHKGNKMDNEMLYRSLSEAMKGNFSKVDESLLGSVINQTGERSFKVDLFNRANEMTSAAKGVNTVYEQNIGFLDILRARTAVLQAGAKTRTGNGSLSYVRQKTAVAATLRGENTGTTTNTYSDFEKVNYIPKALTAKVYLTDELQKESVLDLQGILKGDMVKQFAIAMDNYAINGNTSPAITGLLSAATITAGLYNKDLGVAALPTWATVNALKASVDTKAVDLNACRFIMTPALLGVLEATAKFTNGSAIAESGKINGYGAISTSNMPIATLNHSMIFGDFSNLEICLQGPTEFMVDVQSRFDEGITVLTARQYFDVGVLQPSAFAKCANFLVA
jgi:HK97 family phage major capsid protein